MLSDCDDIVLDVDPAQRIHRVSNQFSSWHEFASEPLEGRDICDLLAPDARPGLRHRLVEIAEGRTCCARLPATAIDTGHLSFTASLTCVSSRTGSAVVTLNPVGRQAVVTARESRLSTTGALVLEGVAAGKASNALAARLHLSSPGVDYHVNALLRRFGVPNRTALVARAYSIGALDAHVWPPRVPPALVG
ncbi:helix-turn-helix transcriptional regulator [Amycolatopsis magusensis]|uniref:helix-turn-helix transcriptional regulator n=1 Tax=Amycolatopsis magusensis TaxID=882444 RepID=UPI00379E6B1D